MIERFTKTLRRLEGGGGASKTMLAVSGGVDSVVMANLYYNSKKSFVLAHCNFQLRGEDSQKDEEFVTQLAANLGVEILVKKFNTARYAKENGISIQMAAREQRYKWFGELFEEYKGRVATAHHANDIAETVLFNLSKGTGIAGLHGISEQDELLIRPLLWATKEEILEYAKRNTLEWREDLSNESEKYMRNIIRKRLVPEIERINPAFVSSNLRTVDRLRESEEFLKYCIEKFDLIIQKGAFLYLDKSKLESLPGRASVLYSLISPYGFNYDQVKSIEQSWTTIGACFYSADWTLNIDRESIIISRGISNPIAITINQDEGKIEIGDNTFLLDIFNSREYILEDNKKKAALDLSKLKFPLLLRTWQEGDRFVPLGMKGKKKVSDFLIDIKMPVTKKKEQLVLISENKIVWLVGLRVDDRAKIGKETEDVCQISWQSKLVK